MSSILQELNELLSGLGVKVETGIFKGKAPDEYCVVTPMSDVFGFFADNQPQFDMQEVRISLFSKQNYMQRKNQIIKALLGAEFTITDRMFIGYDEDTEYFQYIVDVEHSYEVEREE